MTTQAQARLTKKEIALAQISSLAAQGKIEELKKEFDPALKSGLTINEAKDAFVQLYAYAGFPRSLNAIGALMSFLENTEESYPQGRESTKLPDNYDALKQGTIVQTKLVGRPVSGGMMDFAPDADLYLKAHLFGDIFARDVLTHREREVSTIAILASIQGLESQFKSHINMGQNAGLSVADEVEILSNLVKTIGQSEVTRLTKFITE